jgi:hypothetical protein
MNGRRKLRFRMKQPERARLGEVRIPGAQNWNLQIDSRVFRQIDCRCLSRVYPGCVARIRQKRNVTGPRVIQSGRAGNLQVGGTAVYSGSRQGGEFRKFHGKKFSANVRLAVSLRGVVTQTVSLRRLSTLRSVAMNRPQTNSLRYSGFTLSIPDRFRRLLNVD